MIKLIDDGWTVCVVPRTAGAYFVAVTRDGEIVSRSGETVEYAIVKIKAELECRKVMTLNSKQTGNQL